MGKSSPIPFSPFLKKKNIQNCNQILKPITFNGKSFPIPDFPKWEIYKITKKSWIRSDLTPQKLIQPGGKVPHSQFFQSKKLYKIATKGAIEKSIISIFKHENKPNQTTAYRG